MGVKSPAGRGELPDRLSGHVWAFADSVGAQFRLLESVGSG